MSPAPAAPWKESAPEVDAERSSDPKGLSPLMARARESCAVRLLACERDARRPRDSAVSIRALASRPEAISSRVVVCGQVSQRRSSNAITFKSGSLASDGRLARLPKKICLIGSDGLNPGKDGSSARPFVWCIFPFPTGERMALSASVSDFHAASLRGVGRYHSQGRARRKRRGTSAIPGTSTRAFRLRYSAGAQRDGSAFRCIVRIGIGGIFARIDLICSGGGRGGRIEGGAGGRRSRRERCTRDMYTPRPRTGCTTRIPPRWPCARRFRVTASAAGRRTTAA